ncbi:MAG: orotidine-5'-phosphate decarboxylase [Rhizomicrobium sp.]
MTGATRNPLFVALDTPAVPRALELARAVAPYVGGLKVGLEFLTATGPDGLRRIVELGLPVFADVKFHDIPNTVAGASRALAAQGAAFFNVHASGGAAMMRAARDAIGNGEPRPKILGVTILTSLSGDDLAALGFGGTARERVVRLAALAQASGLDGVVCSAEEIEWVRERCGPDFLIVTPGLRPKGAALADQRRVRTPAEALRAGADILVIGRPVTAAADPAEVAHAIAAECQPQA